MPSPKLSLPSNSAGWIAGLRELADHCTIVARAPPPPPVSVKWHPRHQGWSAHALEGKDHRCRRSWPWWWSHETTLVAWEEAGLPSHAARVKSPRRRTAGPVPGTRGGWGRLRGVRRLSARAGSSSSSSKCVSNLASSKAHDQYPRGSRGAATLPLSCTICYPRCSPLVRFSLPPARHAVPNDRPLCRPNPPCRSVREEEPARATASGSPCRCVSGIYPRPHPHPNLIPLPPHCPP